MCLPEWAKRDLKFNNLNLETTNDNISIIIKKSS